MYTSLFKAQISIFKCALKCLVVYRNLPKVNQYGLLIALKIIFSRSTHLTDDDFNGIG